MTDYNRWQQWAAMASDDSAEEESSEYLPQGSTIRKTGNVRVTNLPNSSKLTFGHGGYYVEEESSISQKKDDVEEPRFEIIDDDVDEFPEMGSNLPIVESHGEDSSKSSQKYNSLDDPASGSSGVCDGCKFMWTQDTQTVRFVLQLPTVPRSLTKRDLSLKFEPNTRTISLTWSSKAKDLPTWKWTGVMQFAILLSGEIDNPYDEPFQWSLTSSTEQSVVMEWTKVCPFVGATLWWDRVLTTETPIDVTMIPGRNKTNPRPGSDPLAEAQKLFLERMKQKQTTSPIELNFSDGDES